MANNGQKKIFVFAHWKGYPEPTLMGKLKASPVRGKEVFSFEYEREWLESNFAQVLDPDLGLYTGPQYLNDQEKSNFGIFLDSSPDRWGRVLMRRREAALAKLEKREEKPLYETDYLLGVYDGHRMGGLRFKLEPNGPFLNDNKKMATPPWTTLAELEYASLQLEKDDAPNDPEYLKWLNLLIAPGSSLGGARPKASVRDEKNCLWIAKFPSNKDDSNVGAWELVVSELAKSSGINTADAKISKFSSRYHTFLTKRFDRTQSGERLHFASAMTLLGYSDGHDHQEGASYLELVEFISQSGANVEKNLEELWRRIVFYMCVSNVDDHLRNHGFMLTESGWELSPAYDINPVPTAMGLKLNVSENDNSLDLNLALSVIEYFRIKETQAMKIIENTKNVVKTWREVAKKFGLPQREMESMAPAFKLCK